MVALKALSDQVLIGFSTPKPRKTLNNIFHTFGFQGTVVNRALLSLHGESLVITLAVPLTYKYFTEASYLSFCLVLPFSTSITSLFVIKQFSKILFRSAFLIYEKQS